MNDIMLNLININDWDSLSCHNFLDEETIRKYSHKLNWLLISKTQKLSEVQKGFGSLGDVIN